MPPRARLPFRFQDQGLPDTPPVLTARQQQILDWIRGHLEATGRPPTRAEIAAGLGFSTPSSAEDHLRALEKKGHLQREDLKSRALRPVTAAAHRARGADKDKHSADIVEIPLVGRVAAGLPLLAVENVQDTVHVDRFFIGQTREVFALRVKGDSMIEDGIHDGDFIFVRKQLQANRGDTVVAMINDEATVKRYYPEGDTIRFQPANSSMQPIL